MTSKASMEWMDGYNAVVQFDSGKSVRQAAALSQAQCSALACSSDVPGPLPSSGRAPVAGRHARSERSVLARGLAGGGLRLGSGRGGCGGSALALQRDRALHAKLLAQRLQLLRPPVSHMRACFVLTQNRIYIHMSMFCADLK